jgi:hypothetical protein
MTPTPPPAGVCAAHAAWIALLVTIADAAVSGVSDAPE